MRRFTNILLQLGLTFTFVFSGIVKVLAPDRFLLDIQAFQMLPGWIAYAVALGLPWLELVAAAGLWWKGLARGSALLLGSMAIAFIAMLLLAELRGLDLECGCFGDWIVFPNLASHLAFNTVLAAASFWLLKKEPTE